ncbi:nitric oxide reductase transcriptional regulator NorR [Aidingimonas halophila]|uniref:Anaerobic nitric oxide reductase transcription regulator n=1 Tax=Aidingimonas halophila TaxID=574349 RepID=A0A1H2X1I9_9GAMM|nr:nitric oxide reductase transcriptional regulator NorR [Aidingimonas halophila]GHC27882.1 anaerobic nitric oxide reductase transcriptional regulator [Aidingimonas halophila]SDW86099.1 anaerobic nitric oxide reductase transcription regulator [Aidingimonas halophila]
MTEFLKALRTLLAHLADNEATETQWATLLQTLVGGFPADASTLMVTDGEALRPVALLGLNEEVRGRRFVLHDHPRLAAIASHPGVCRFPQDSPLPDPFDGLIDDDLSEVHDCLGVALRDGDRLTGLLTLDALTPGSLDSLDDDQLSTIAQLLGTCLRLAEQLRTTRTRLNEALAQEQPSDVNWHWNSRAMRQLDEAIELVAPTDMSVLLHGETGVGKELAVRALHQRSRRHQGPLIKVNCAALPESLIESELFGHRRGAFSGATQDRRGHFAMADGGTLMLDEIGELPLSLQPKLLRVLQEGEIQPLGSERPQRVDVRVVAVTNRDLGAEADAGRFRQDLYHRLSAFPLRVPPLRERPEDIPLLAGHFLEANRIRLGLNNLRLDQDAETVLFTWHWPGNVRELEHTLARAALRALGERAPVATSEQRQAVALITRDHLDLHSDSRSTSLGNPSDTLTAAAPPAMEPLPLREATDAFQRHHIQATLNAYDGNWAAAARSLNIDPGNLHRQAKRLGLKR